ncbi:MAG: hypothetical protein GXO87_00790 [Chlorobi bacterium]|nr:hypothetical protein [Chlorobiota bacterium]
MKKLSILFMAIFIAVFFINGCENRSELIEPTVSAGNADFTTFVTIGNSLTAGYQSGALYESSQKYSIGNIISMQVKGKTFEQPIVSNPGLVGRMEVSSLSPFTVVENPESGAPTNTGYAKPYNNLGIPGILLVDALETRQSPSEYSGENPFIDMVLRGKGTVVEQALSLQPTFITAWLGNNDILGYATSGGLLPHTPPATFDFLYNTFAGALASSGAHVLVATLPNVTGIPFFITVGPGVGQALKDMQAANPAILGLFYQTSTAYGLATPDDLLQLKTLLTLTGSSATKYLGDVTGAYYTATGAPVPPGVDISQPFGLHPANPFPNQYVLDPAELAETESVIKSFNTSIRNAAAQFGFALSDIYAFFNKVAETGYDINGLHFTNTYVSGGTFGLDGVHPTSRGYAVIADQFISAINTKFGSKIPWIDVSTVHPSIDLAGYTPGKYGIPNISSDVFKNLYY